MVGSSALRVPLVSKSSPIAEKISTKQKNPCTPRGDIGSFSSTRVWKRLRQVGFSHLSAVPDHTRRRCDHAVWDSVHEHDRVGVG